MEGGFDQNPIKSMQQGDGRTLRAALLWLNTMLVILTILIFWWDRRSIPFIDIVITLLLVLELAAHWVWVRDQETQKHKSIPPVDDETAQAFYHETKTKRREDPAQASVTAAYRVIKHREPRETDDIADADYTYPDTLHQDMTDEDALPVEVEDMRGAYIGEDGEIYYDNDDQARRAARR
jgi:hypothetical protein